MIREREVDGETVRNELKSNYRRKLTGGKLVVLTWRDMNGSGAFSRKFCIFLITYIYENQF